MCLFVRALLFSLMKKLYWTSFILFYTIAVAHAQSIYIRGKITDGNKKVLLGSTVILDQLGFGIAIVNRRLFKQLFPFPILAHQVSYTQLLNVICLYYTNPQYT